MREWAEPAHSVQDVRGRYISLLPAKTTSPPLPAKHTKQEKTTHKEKKLEKEEG